MELAARVPTKAQSSGFGLRICLFTNCHPPITTYCWPLQEVYFWGIWISCKGCEKHGGPQCNRAVSAMYQLSCNQSQTAVDHIRLHKLSGIWFYCPFVSGLAVLHGPQYANWTFGNRWFRTKLSMNELICLKHFRPSQGLKTTTFITCNSIIERQFSNIF